MTPTIALRGVARRRRQQQKAEALRAALSTLGAIESLRDLYRLDVPPAPISQHYSQLVSAIGSPMPVVTTWPPNVPDPRCATESSGATLAKPSVESLSGRSTRSGQSGSGENDQIGREFERERIRRALILEAAMPKAVSRFSSVQPVPGPTPDSDMKLTYE